MGDFFTALWFISLLCLVAGLAKPSLFAFLYRSKTSRRFVGTTLGAISIVLLLVAGALAEQQPKPAPTPKPVTTPTPSATPVSQVSKQPTPSGEAQAIAIVGAKLSGNKLGISEKDLRTKSNPKGQGTFVYSSQTRYSGVERYILWLVMDSQAYPLNGATQGVTPDLKLPREAPEDSWRATGLDKYSTSEAIEIVFGKKGG